MTTDTEEQAGGYDVLTSRGPAAIAIVRAWGPAVAEFLDRHVRTARPHACDGLQPGRVARATLTNADGQPLDDILFSVHGVTPAPDVCLHLHGNPVVVDECVAALAAAGLAAAPGGGGALFGDDDRVACDAHALLPAMRTLAGVAWTLGMVPRLRRLLSDLKDLPPDRARITLLDLLQRRHVAGWYTTPLRIAVVGPPNVGKSTLVNALAGAPVSLVASTPGTTRDWVEAPGEIDGFPVLWLDTAGLRATDDNLEAAGTQQTRRVAGKADATVVVLDAAAGSVPTAFLTEHAGLTPACVALNKVDLKVAPEPILAALPGDWRNRAALVSARKGTGLEVLGAEVLRALGRSARTVQAVAPLNARQAALLTAAAEAGAPKGLSDKILEILGSVAIPGGGELR